MIKSNKLIAQTFFWVLLIGVQYLFISHLVPFPKSILFICNIVFFTAILMYGNVYYFYPKFNNSQNNLRFNLFSVSAIILLAIGAGYIEYSLFKILEVDVPKRFKYPLLPSVMKSMFWLTLVHLVSTIYLLQDGLRKKSEETKMVVEQKLNTELKYLKAQINPHFLFNALNNIYSLSYLKSDKGPDAVLKLSNMLRYVLEDCQADHVRLSSEIAYIQNFIDFQQMKTPNSQNIVFKTECVDDSLLLAPMLLIPFIENSFKYSKVESTENAYVIIEMNSDKKSINLTIKNSVPLVGKSSSGSGKGIENVKHRLSILYPKKHELKIANDDVEFVVFLKIQYS